MPTVFTASFDSTFQQFLSDSEAALKAEKERKYAKRVSLKSYENTACKISSYQGLKPPSSAGSGKKFGAVEPEGDLPAVSG